MWGGRHTSVIIEERTKGGIEYGDLEAARSERTNLRCFKSVKKKAIKGELRVGS